MEKKWSLQGRNPTTNQIGEAGCLRFKNVSPERAELYFYGDIVSSTWSTWEPEDKCPQDIANFLSGLDNYQSIDIYVNSGGGSVFGGLAIYQQLKRHQGEKVVHVDGIAASIASVISFAGDRVIVPRTAQLMIHKPMSSIYGGTADDYRKEASALDTCEQTIINVYMEHVKDGVTEDQIRQMVDDETWMTGEQAAQYFDIEVEDSAEAVACASGYFGQYKHMPESMHNQKPEEDLTQLQLELEFLSL